MPTPLGAREALILFPLHALAELLGPAVISFPIQYIPTAFAFQYLLPKLVVIGLSVVLERLSTAVEGLSIADQILDQGD